MVPFYESNGVCVETCPENEFGNHTSGQCQPCKCIDTEGGFLAFYVKYMINI